jgi:Flp pilus assembly protein TadD
MTHSKTTSITFLFLGVCFILTACQSNQSHFGSRNHEVRNASDPRRDTHLAKLHNANGLKHIENKNYELAEIELKKALEADLFFGPAHNNLGIVYYNTDRYYEAAWEFEYAMKLMPRKAEPRNNLGMVFEAALKLAQAAEWYEKALFLKPEAFHIKANLARVYVRDNRQDSKTRQLLETVATEDPRPEWTQWANDQLSLMSWPRTKREDEPAAISPTPLP